MNSRYLPLAIESFLEFKPTIRNFFLDWAGALKKTSEQDSASLCSSRIRTSNGMDIPLRDLLGPNYENKKQDWPPQVP